MTAHRPGTGGRRSQDHQLRVHSSRGPACPRPSSTCFPDRCWGMFTPDAHACSVTTVNTLNSFIPHVVFISYPWWVCHLACPLSPLQDGCLPCDLWLVVPDPGPLHTHGQSCFSVTRNFDPRPRASPRLTMATVDIVDMPFKHLSQTTGKPGWLLLPGKSRCQC